MNDFTLEELKEIRACVCNIDGKVLEKIQSMIDNYCEHEWENICHNCDLHAMYCHKCEKRMSDFNLKQRYENE